jgi:trk system potassium uptake protein TrkA
VVAVKSPGENFTYASHETTLTYDDLILATGRVDDVDRLVNLE